MKKIVTIVIVTLIVASLASTFCFTAHAVTLSVSGNLPGLSANPTNPGAWINGFYNLALMLGGVLAFGAVVYGGVLYAASAGNASKQSEGKEWIWAALTGLLLLAGAWLVLNTINPTLTNVSFPTLSSLSATSGGAGGDAITGPGNGACTATSCGTGQTCINQTPGVYPTHICGTPTPINPNQPIILH
jgi:hypothetical protein